MNIGAEGVTDLAPSLLVKESVGGQVEVAVICEGQVLYVVPGIEAPLAIISAFYTFRMSYPKGLVNLLTFLGITLLGIRQKKKLTKAVSHALSCFAVRESS